MYLTDYQNFMFKRTIISFENALIAVNLYSPNARHQVKMFVWQLENINSPLFRRLQKPDFIVEFMLNNIIQLTINFLHFKKI